MTSWMRTAKMKTILVMSLFVVICVDAGIYKPLKIDKSKCVKEVPKAKKLGVYFEKQPYTLRKDIAIKLWNYRAIKADVWRIAKKYNDIIIRGSHYYDAHATCPSSIKYITAIDYHNSKCFVVYPQYIPVALCEQRTCFKCTKFFKSGCFQDSFWKYKFWVYCKGKGFYLVEKYLPQCCSCYFYSICKG